MSNSNLPDLTSDFLLNEFKTLIHEFTKLNNENNTNIPVFGIYLYNIINALNQINYDIQNKYEIIIYNPFDNVDAWFENNPLYTHGNQISFQNLDKLNDLLDSLTAAVNYIKASSYQNYLVDTIPGYVGRLQYAIQFITRYTDNTNENYGNVVCDHNTTYAKYNFNDVKIFCGST